MIYALLSPWVLWGVYGLVMRLKQVRDAGRLTTAQKVFGYPWLIVGLVLDFFVNVFIGSFLFLEVPHELTLSSRLWRLSTTSSGYRQRVALWLRVQLLDSLDPAGIHRG